jgi:uncharacterized protein YutE (UPF0331/DUF86 family)
MPLRREFVERKLQLIVEDLGRLVEFQDVSFDELVSDGIRLAAVERILERMILRAIDVNEHLIGAISTGAEERSTRLTYRDTFLQLSDQVYPGKFAERIARSAGLRNILVHEYNDVDHRILHASIRTALEDYSAYVEHVQGFLRRTTPADDRGAEAGQA